MEQWLRDTFEIVPNGWDNGDGTDSDTFAFNSNGNVITAPIWWFIATFGSVTIPPIEAELKAVDPGNSMGWHTHFEAWKSQGIIN